MPGIRAIKSFALDVDMAEALREAEAGVKPKHARIDWTPDMDTYIRVGFRKLGAVKFLRLFRKRFNCGSPNSILNRYRLIAGE